MLRDTTIVTIVICQVGIANRQIRREQGAESHLGDDSGCLL